MLKKIFSRKIIVFVLLVAVCGGGFFVYRKSNSDGTPTYTTATVQKGTLIVSVSGSGSMAAKNTADVNPGISGEVVSVNVAEGGEVSKGQVLFSIKNDDLAVAQTTAYTTYLQAKEALEKVKLDKLSTQEDLDNLKEKENNDPDSVSDLQIQIVEQKVRSAELSIKSAENKVWQAGLDSTKAKEEAEKREVKAPIDGTITSLDVSVGDELGGSNAASSAAGGSSSSVLTIVDLENLIAQIDINEIDALNVKKDQKATLTFDVFAEEKKFTGKVSKVDTLGTTTQGVTTYQTEITLDSIEPTIKPGMTVSADIITESKDNVLLVPNSAIKTSGETNFVQVLADDGTINNIAVEVGLASTDQTEIISGVSEGDKVVIAVSTQGTSNTSFGGQNLRGIMPGGGFGGGEVRITR